MAAPQTWRRAPEARQSPCRHGRWHLEVHGFEFTSSSQGNSSLLLELFSQVPPDEPIDNGIAEGAYNTLRRHGAIINEARTASYPFAATGAIGRKITQQSLRGTKSVT